VLWLLLVLDSIDDFLFPENLCLYCALRWCQEFILVNHEDRRPHVADIFQYQKLLVHALICSSVCTLSHASRQKQCILGIWLLYRTSIGNHIVEVSVALRPLEVAETALSLRSYVIDISITNTGVFLLLNTNRKLSCLSLSVLSNYWKGPDSTFNLANW